MYLNFKFFNLIPRMKDELRTQSSARTHLFIHVYAISNEWIRATFYVASEKGFWNQNDVYENIGFKHFFSQKDYSKEKQIGMSLNNQQFFLETIDHMISLQTVILVFKRANDSYPVR